MREFRAALYRRGLADATVSSRCNMVRRWWAFIGDPFDDAVTFHDVDAFVDASRMRAAVSRAAAVSHLHGFYRWARREQYVRDDPTELVDRPRIRPGLPRPADETDLMLAITLSSGVMHAAIVVAATCGLRCVELCRLRWEDVGVDTLRVRGKGDRVRVIPLQSIARDALDELERVDGWVFPWREYRSVAPGVRASQAINTFLRSIGTSTTAHQLRHWCATTALAGTGDLRGVQEFLGHASPATTAIYTRLHPERLEHVAQAVHLPAIA